MRQPAVQIACPGCLDGGRCWVCLGQGSFETAKGVETGCSACDGSGSCPHCKTSFVRPVFLQRPA